MRMNNKRTGAVTPLIAICLVVIVGCVAMAIDGGLLLDRYNRVQSTADVAALAAAEDLFLHWNANQGLDPSGTAKDAAIAAANANGFTSVTVNIPPTSGTYAAKAGYAEVIILHNQRRYFSSIFGSSTVPVKSRAVAQGRWAAAKVGILVLNPTGSGSLTDTGGGALTVLGAPLIVDSNAPDAATTTGGGTVTFTELDVVGVPGTSGSGFWVGPVNSGQQPVPDPLASVPAPNPATMTVQANRQTHPSGNNTTTLSPGVYQGGISVSGQASLIMLPGVYYMDGGGFSFTGQGSLSATGVMIYNAPQSNSDVVNINGSGAINLTPPTTGIYQGISIFQARSSTNTISVTGNGASTYSGTFYTAKGTLNVTGNGGGNVIGSQYISYNLTVNGNGNFNVSWNPNTTGRTRLIGLVE